MFKPCFIENNDILASIYIYITIESSVDNNLQNNRLILSFSKLVICIDSNSKI